MLRYLAVALFCVASLAMPASAQDNWRGVYRGGEILLAAVIAGVIVAI